MILLRRATMADAELLFVWRNDPLTRKNSRNTDEVPWPAHLSWLADTLKRDDRLLLIGDNGQMPVGTVRFDRHDDYQEISWTGSPVLRGHGASKEMAVNACRLIDEAIVAEIRFDNAPTINMIKACGFRQTSVGAEFGIWRRDPLTTPTH